MMLVFWKCNKSATIRQSRLFGGCRAGWGLALTLLLAACSTIDDSQDGCPEAQVSSGNPDGAIAFSIDEGSTRAAKNTLTTDGSGANEASLQTLGFGVFASYTGLHKYSESTVKPDFMYNDRIHWDTDKWTYSPLRYWPNGEGEAPSGMADNPHYVSFFAYAPYSDGDSSDPATNPAGYCIPSFSNNHELGDPWLIYRIIDQENLDKQVDLAYAMNLDEYRHVPNQAVSFSFNHALACFGDKVTIALDKKDDPDDSSEPDKAQEALERLENVEVVLTNVSIDYALTNKAKLVLWNNGDPYWQPVLSEQMIAYRTVTFLDETSHPDGYTLFSRSGWTTDDSLNKNDDGKFCWESTEDHAIFFIPLEVEGYPQTATLSVTYDVLVDGVKDETMSKTKSTVLKLNQYYSDFKHGGWRLNVVNGTLTWEED